jgi:hypothetical protein
VSASCGARVKQHARLRCGAYFPDLPPGEATGSPEGSVAAREAKDHHGRKGLIAGQGQRDGAGSAVDGHGLGGATRGTAGDLGALCFPCVLFVDIANNSKITNIVNGLIGRSAEIRTRDPQSPRKVRFKRKGKGGRDIMVPITDEVRAILWPLRGNHSQCVFTYVAERTRDGNRPTAETSAGGRDGRLLRYCGRIAYH